MIPRVAAIAVSLAACSLLSGCFDWVVPGDHDDRGYDGRTDDLTATPVDERTAPLADRFDLIQAR